MNYYETLYLINPNLPEETYQEVLLKFNGLIEKNKGVLIKVEEWGKRTLAYPVKKFDKGYYVLVQYCGEPDVTEELERDLRLDDRTLKYQTIKLSGQTDPEELQRQVQQTQEKAPVEETGSAEGASGSSEESESKEDQEE